MGAAARARLAAALARCKGHPDPVDQPLWPVDRGRAFHRMHRSFREAGPRTCAQIAGRDHGNCSRDQQADAAVFIRQIRALGVQVALDDFGAGDPRSAYLKTLRWTT